MEKFSPTFDSLRKFQCPDWFRDAKFGIWSHWGPQSVPMYGDWYARNMYVEGSPQYLYHLRHYGHPSKFGYKDLVQLWKAENFDPDGLMDLYYKAGARYFVAQAMHHDHFFNFETRLNRFNSVEMGPKKDIVGMWKAAAQKYGMPFGLTEHLGASFSWWNVNKGCDKHGPYAGVPYDGNDPAYKDFYYENLEDTLPDAAPGTRAAWYTENQGFRDYWLKVMKELIDKYTPDLLYSDGPLPFGKGGTQWGDHPTQLDEATYKQGLEAVAYLYNKSMETYGENRALYNQKDRRPEVYNVGVLDIEKSQLPNILPQPWQTDTCIGNWFYDVRQNFKTAEHVVEMLVDIIAKNGTMLLNILQRPDGTVDDETLFLLHNLADWFAVCAEGVYGTRPWRISGEGDTRVVIDGFKEDKVQWNSSDFRFVHKNDTLYAFMMAVPENGVSVIKSLRPDEKVKAVRLLGVGNVEWNQSFGVLSVKLPEKLPVKAANCLAITL